MPIIRATRATGPGAMVATAGRVDLREATGTIAARVAMDLRVPVVGAMINVGRVPAGRRKGVAMSGAGEIAAEAGVPLSSGASRIASPRHRWCGRLR